MNASSAPALLIGYHGTAAAAPVFDVETGAFFASHAKTAHGYCEKSAAYRLRMENPAVWSLSLIDGFKDYLMERREDGYSENEVEQFNRRAIHQGCQPGEESMDEYVKVVLRIPARDVTFSDTDSLFHLLRDHLREQGHDGLIRPHEYSDFCKDGTLEYVPFEQHQIAPLLSPDAPKAVRETKLRDDHGHPLVVYRGEQGGDHFEKFDRRKTRERGFFFTPVREIAEGYDRNGIPRAFALAADKVLDLTNDSMANRKWVDQWAKSFDAWVDRRSGEERDAFSVLEGGGMFDYEGDWSGERWKDLVASAEHAGFDVVILPDLDNSLGVFPSVVAFRPDQIWEIKPPAPAIAQDDIVADQKLLRGGGGLAAPGAPLPAPALAGYADRDIS